MHGSQTNRQEPASPSRPRPQSQPDGYGQLCPVALALDLVGQRWALLILRDLARAPLRFSDLQSINPSISPTVLTQRLRALEDSGLIERRRHRGPSRTTLYSMSATARDVVTPVLTSLADLGAHLIEQDPPVSDQVEALVEQMQLNSRFVAARSSGLEGYFVLDLSGWEIHLVITEGDFEASAEPPGDRPPDGKAVFFPPTTMMRILGLVLTPDEAEAEGLLTIEGDRVGVLELLRLLSFEAGGQGSGGQA